MLGKPSTVPAKALPAFAALGQVGSADEHVPHAVRIDVAADHEVQVAHHQRGYIFIL